MDTERGVIAIVDAETLKKRLDADAKILEKQWNNEPDANAKMAIDYLYYINREFKVRLKQHAVELIEGKTTNTKPGSIAHLMFGSKPSMQSIMIKMGKVGEFMSKELIKLNPNLKLLGCGVQDVDGIKKDIDLIWIDVGNKKLYYRELKGNIELDTEKLPATASKCKEIEVYLKKNYPDYTIDYGILNWSVYNRKILTAGLSNIKTFEKGGIKIDHMGDFLRIINVAWDEDDYYSCFREIGTEVTTKFNNS